MNPSWHDGPTHCPGKGLPQMPIRPATELPEQKSLYELLSPYGYADCIHGAFGECIIEMVLTFNPSDALETVAAVRAYAFSQAGKILAALEDDGREICAVSVTVSGIPVEATMRMEISTPG